MDFSRLGRGELVAAVGGLLLGVCLFLPWYETAPDNPNAFILIWIVIRDHELSWARGEMTAVAAIAAFGLVAYMGFLDRPGSPSGEISLQAGFYGALLGTILMIVGGAMTAGQTERTRKPPGVL
jgi:membrane protease YdiL (CAAX protease family)